MRPKPMKKVLGSGISFEKFKGSRSRKTCMPFLAGLIALACAACNGRAPETMQVSTSPAATKAEISKSKEIENCRHLHKVVDLYDLLKQMHDNLDSDCVLKMDGKKLEQIWGLEINGVSPWKFKNGLPANFSEKHYEVPLDAFYVIKLGENGEGGLHVALTLEAMARKKKIFDGDRFPEFLSNYNSVPITGHSPSHDIGVPIDVPRNRISQTSDLKYRTRYYWRDQYHPVTCMEFLVLDKPDMIVNYRLCDRNERKRTQASTEK